MAGHLFKIKSSHKNIQLELHMHSYAHPVITHEKSVTLFGESAGQHDDLGGVNAMQPAKAEAAGWPIMSRSSRSHNACETQILQCTLL
jgi:hypothetical protein